MSSALTNVLNDFQVDGEISGDSLDITGGGTFGGQVSITSSSFEPLQVERSSAGGSAIEFLNSTEQLGRIGYQADKEFGFISPDNGTVATISNTGNLDATGEISGDSLNMGSGKFTVSNSGAVITETSIYADDYIEAAGYLICGDSGQSSAIEGAIRFNTSTNKHQGYNGTSWNDLY
jgi:hypothetical protein